jgi:hypothetical protein
MIPITRDPKGEVVETGDPEQTGEDLPESEKTSREPFEYSPNNLGMGTTHLIK